MSWRIRNTSIFLFSTPWRSCDRFVIRGMFNTGTNYIQRLLEVNRAAAYPDYFACWKHAPPWEIQPLPGGSRVLEVYMVRHPLIWMQSMQKAWYSMSCKNGTLTDCELRYMYDFSAYSNDCTPRQDSSSIFRPTLEDIWYEYYGGYIQRARLQATRGYTSIIVRYEDAVDSPEFVLRILTAEMGVAARKMLLYAEPAKKHGHAHGTIEARRRLTTYPHNMFLPSPVLMRVRTNANVKHLATQLGYRL